MAKYRVTERSFINNAIVDVDAVVEYDGVPASNLEPVDAAAQLAATQDTSAADALRQTAATLGADLSDPVAVASAQAVVAAQAQADAQVAVDAAAALAAAADAQVQAAATASASALV